MSSPRCYNCNREVSPSARFCQYCGASFSPQVVHNAQQYQQQPQPPPPQMIPVPYPAKRDTGIGSALTFLVLVIIFAFVWPGWLGTELFGTASTTNSVSDEISVPAAPEVSDYLNVMSNGRNNDLDLIEWSTKNDEYTRYVVGKVKNTGSSSISYAQIVFSLFDAEGNQVGTAMDNINNLGAGSTWSFSAVVIEDSAAKVNFSELTGF